MRYTLHKVIAYDGWESYALVCDDGTGYVLGERHDVVAAAAAINAFFETGELAETLDEDAEELGTLWYSTSEAVAAAHDYDPNMFPTDGLAHRIRQAAQDGRISGCQKSPTGRWKFQSRKFRAWIADEDAHRPGRQGHIGRDQDDGDAVVHEVDSAIEFPDFDPIWDADWGLGEDKVTFHRGVPAEVEPEIAAILNDDNQHENDFDRNVPGLKELDAARSAAADEEERYDSGKCMRSRAPRPDDRGGTRITAPEMA